MRYFQRAEYRIFPFSVKRGVSWFSVANKAFGDLVRDTDLLLKKMKIQDAIKAFCNLFSNLIDAFILQLMPAPLFFLNRCYVAEQPYVTYLVIQYQAF